MQNDSRKKNTWRFHRIHMVASDAAPYQQNRCNGRPIMLFVLCSEDLIASQLSLTVLTLFFHYCNQLIKMHNDSREKFTCCFDKMYTLDSNAYLLHTQIHCFAVFGYHIHSKFIIIINNYLL